MVRTPPSERSGRTSDQSPDRSGDGLPVPQPVDRAVTGAIRRTTPEAALILTAVIGGGLTLGLAAAGAAVYDAVAEHDGVAGLDHPVLRRVMAWRSTSLDHFLTAFTFLGGP